MSDQQILSETEEFVQQMRAFCTQFGFSESGFGHECLNNRNFFSDVKSKKISPTLKTVTKVRNWMKNYRVQKENSNA